MGRAWQPVGDASWDVEDDARRRRAQPEEDPVEHAETLAAVSEGLRTCPEQLLELEELVPFDRRAALADLRLQRFGRHEKRAGETMRRLLGMDEAHNLGEADLILAVPNHPGSMGA